MSLGILLSWCLSVGADVFDNWTIRNVTESTPAWPSLSDVAYGNGLFVAVGNTIITSTNGVNWPSATSATNLALKAVTYGNSQFVAVGDHTILTSADGRNWLPASSVPRVSLSDIAFGGGSFVATVADGGNQGAVLTSADGTNWVARVVPTAARDSYIQIDAVAYGNGRFVVAGYGMFFSSMGNFYEPFTGVSSDQGATWTVAPLDSTQLPVRGLGFGDGQLVMVSLGGTVFNSTDGLNWQQHSAPSLSGSGPAPAVAYGAGRFVAVAGAQIFASTNAIDWLGESQSGAYLLGITFGAGQFVAVGDHTLLRSVDGVNWSSAGDAVDFSSAACGGGHIVALGPDGVVASADGTNWVRGQLDAPASLYSVTYGRDQFVAVGARGAILTSADGTQWRTRKSGVTDDLIPVAFGNGQFVAVDLWADMVLTSTDGVAWVKRPVESGGFYSNIAFGNGLVVLGSQYQLLTLDTTDWSVKGSLAGNWTSLGYGNGTFVAVTFDGKLMASTDGLKWNEHPTDQFHYGSTQIVYGSGYFVAVTQYEGSILYSRDGLEWVHHALPSELPSVQSSVYVWPRFALAHADGQFVVVGQQGLILESDLVVPRLSLARAGTGNALRLSWRGPVGSSSAIEKSTDLISWGTLTNMVGGQATDLLIGAPPNGVGGAFYRLHSAAP